MEKTVPEWTKRFLDFNSNAPVNRLAYTDEDTKYKVEIMKKMQELGMQISYDTIGNICGFLPAHGKAHSNLVLCSHTDCVPDGGQYDGPAGIISYLMAIETLQNKGAQIPNNIHLIICACEESSRFDIACVGSKYLAGKLKSEDHAKTDNAGMPLGDAAKDFLKSLEKGIQSYNIKAKHVDAVVGKDECDTAIELHIEQCDTLAKGGNQIGIATSIPGVYRIKLSIKGQGGHTGTPLSERKDAMYAFGEFLHQAYKIEHETDGNIIVTIPGNETDEIFMNKIQDYVCFKMDARIHIPMVFDDAAKRVEQIICDVEKRTGVKFTKEVLGASNPFKTDEKLSKKLHSLSEGLGLRTIDMRSPAGHDVAILPAKQRGLIFIPSTNGSHNHKEHTTKQDILNGVAVLEQLILGCDSRIR